MCICRRCEKYDRRTAIYCDPCMTEISKTIERHAHFVDAFEKLKSYIELREGT